MVVCADDFGLSAAACQSILTLGSAAAISATSCAVDGPVAAVYAAALRELRPGLAVGLHLNLTENPQFGASRSLPLWILAAYSRVAIDREALQHEIRRQLHCFERLFGAPPDFVDGHEHVHQLPVIRGLLVDELWAQYGDRVALRATSPAEARGAKAALINLLGARALQRLAARRGLYCNSDFAGVYNLSGDGDYAPHMESWLRGVRDGGLIMCHPETPDGTRRDARTREHEFLASPAWPQMLQRCAVSLVPLRAPGARLA